jgi:hypothetical protein
MTWHLWALKPIATIGIFLLAAFGCSQFSIPHKPVSSSDIDMLDAKGFTHVGAKKIHAMQEMRRPIGVCKAKRNVCGMDAGISAGFLLDPQEAFYDVANPPFAIFFGDGKSDYDKLGEGYPIMRPVRLPSIGLGVFPHTLAMFWTKSFKHHQAKHFGFDKVKDLLERAQEEIKAGRPILVQVRISAPGFPLFLPDDHLGPRGFHNAHWVVVLGFSDREWLIRDNSGLEGTVDYERSFSWLITISNESFEKIANLAALADDLKTYQNEPNLPVFLDDWDSQDNDQQLREDFRAMKAFNLIAFEKK